MAVRLRLQRHGRKGRPFYRVVAADARSSRDGRFVEQIGYYDPMTDPSDIVIDGEKALKWLRTGAQPTDTTKRLLTNVGVWDRFNAEKSGEISPDLPFATETETDENSESEEE